MDGSEYSDYSDDFDNVSLDDYNEDYDDDDSSFNFSVPDSAGNLSPGRDEVATTNQTNDECVHVPVPETTAHIGCQEHRGSEEREHRANTSESIDHNHTRCRDSESPQLIKSEGELRDASPTFGDAAYTSSVDSISERAKSNTAGQVSKTWKKEMLEFDIVYSKCTNNEKRRHRESSVISSSIAKEARHSRAMVERQLQVALNQLNSYRKENAFLVRKVDTSLIQSEIDRLKSIATDQQLKIKQLTDENRALNMVRRNHEKQLLEVEREKEEAPCKEQVQQKQLKLFDKKLKSLKNQLVNYQVRDRTQYRENQDLKQQNMKLQIKLQAVAMSQSVRSAVRREGGEGLGVGEDGMSMELPSVHMSEEIENGSIVSNEVVDMEKLHSEIRKLKTVISNQRSSYKQQLTTLQTRLEKSLQKRKELEAELKRREKEMKVQVCPIRNVTTILTVT